MVLLVSCFSGEESAMELWLLLSSAGENGGERKLVNEGVREKEKKGKRRRETA